MQDDTEQRRVQNHDNECGGCSDGSNANLQRKGCPLQACSNEHHRTTDPIAGTRLKAQMHPTTVTEGKTTVQSCPAMTVGLRADAESFK